MAGTEAVGLVIGAAMTAGGLGVAWMLWRLWAGHYRRWPVDFLERAPLLGLGPLLAFGLLGTGLARLLGDPVGGVLAIGCYALGVLSLLAGLLYAIFASPEAGPRWHREQLADRTPPPDDHS